MFKKIMTAVDGFLMACADSVPGVSGGTVAFLMGIYDEFISSVNGIISKDKEERKRSLLFLINLGIGWVVGFAAAVTVLAGLFTEKIYFISSMFIGFILFSIPIVARQEKETLTAKPSRCLFIIPGAALVLLITFMRPDAAAGMLDFGAPGIAEYLMLFIGGAAAVSAMVLPGISGSTIMLIMGMYLPVITAVKDLLHLDFSALKILIPAGLGILTGALLIIKLIKAALDKHRTALMYFILGMMAASLAAVVKGPETLEEPQAAMTFGTFDIIGFIIGGAVIVLLCVLEAKMRGRQQEK